MEQIIENQPMSEYLCHPGIGSSTLKKILESPKDYQYQFKTKQTETSAQRKGTLWHSFLIEPDKYHQQYLVQPEDWGPLTKNPGREKWAALKKTAESLGKTPVKFSESQDLHLLEAEMKDHAALQKILLDYKPEVSFYTDYNGHILKSREDIWCPTTGEVWDVKTTSGMFKNGRGIDENLSDIIFQNGYHFQAAHHTNVMKLAGAHVTSWGWIFVATDTPAPHIIVRKASEKLLAAGQQDWQHAIRLLDECEKNENWVGFDDEIFEIDLPEWAERYYEK